MSGLYFSPPYGKIGVNSRNGEIPGIHLGELTRVRVEGMGNWNGTLRVEFWRIADEKKHVGTNECEWLHAA